MILLLITPDIFRELFPDRATLDRGIDKSLMGIRIGGLQQICVRKAERIDHGIFLAIRKNNDLGVASSRALRKHDGVRKFGRYVECRYPRSSHMNHNVFMGSRVDLIPR